MPEDGFEAVAAEVSQLDLDDFFDASVRGTGELPLETLLGTHGIAYNLRAASGSGDKGGQKLENSKQRTVWLGATLSETNGKSTFASVMNGGPAERAGVPSQGLPRRRRAGARRFSRGRTGDDTHTPRGGSARYLLPGVDRRCRAGRGITPHGVAACLNRA
jgi:hypothetical protein